MTCNPEPIVPHLHHALQTLLAYVTGPEARWQTAYTMEWTLFRRRLTLGAALWRWFLVTRAAVRPAEPGTAPDGTRLPDHAQRWTTDDAVWGNGRFARHSCTAPGHEGLCPLDAARSLPARCSSDLLREWAVYGATDAAYRESRTVLERILGRARRLQAIEHAVGQAGEAGTPCDDPPAEPAAAPPVATMLVVQADGQGVPRVQPPMQRPAVRLATGSERTKQKEAVVTGL